MEKILLGVGAFVVSILLIAVLSLIAPLWVVPLWNWLMPTLFGLAKITYWQAWGLCLLCGTLFKSGSVSSKK